MFLLLAKTLVTVNTTKTNVFIEFITFMLYESYCIGVKRI